MKCAACGADNKAGRRFCGQCGASLQRLCASCGAANDEGERFCGDCGAPLDAAGDLAGLLTNLEEGDILFIDGTPIAWAGPVSNWIKACDRIMAMDVDAIVPGHGPITDKGGVKRMQDYLVHVDRETRKRHAAGMNSWEAAQDIGLGSFGAWDDAGRLAVTVETIYREIDADRSPRNLMELFSRMMQLETRYAAARN